MAGVFRSAIRLLTFRITREELDQFGNRHLLLGLVCTWIVGRGRYWDHPNAELLQYLGVGSVIYIFILSLLLWLVVLPLRPLSWSYRKVLTFVSLTSPPAILYAIPVERFYNIETASTINVWFLVVVATWRVALMLFYFRRQAGLPYYSILLASLLPLSMSVAGLAILNLEKAVFEFMAGIHERRRTSNDIAYEVVFLLGLAAYLLFIPILILYLTAVTVAYLKHRKKACESI